MINPNKRHIDHTIINEVHQMVKEHGVDMSDDEIYHTLLEFNIIHTDGTPTKEAVKNGYITYKPTEVKTYHVSNGKETSQNMTPNEYYHHLLAALPEAYIEMYKDKDSKQDLEPLIQTRELFLHKPFNTYTTNDLGATIYFSYKLLSDMDPKMAIGGKQILRDNFNKICKMYIDRVGSDKGLDQISRCIKNVKSDGKLNNK